MELTFVPDAVELNVLRVLDRESLADRLLLIKTDGKGQVARVSVETNQNDHAATSATPQSKSINPLSEAYCRDPLR